MAGAAGLAVWSVMGSGWGYYDGQTAMQRPPDASVPAEVSRSGTAPSRHPLRAALAPDHGGLIDRCGQPAIAQDGRAEPLCSACEFTFPGAMVCTNSVQPRVSTAQSMACGAPSMA